MMGMRWGIHVYVQKPSLTVWEARQLAEMARKNNICTQMGNQGTAADGLREGADIYPCRWTWGCKRNSCMDEPSGMAKAPIITARPTTVCPYDHLDWNSFIGPAPIALTIHPTLRLNGEAGGTTEPVLW